MQQPIGNVTNHQSAQNKPVLSVSQLTNAIKHCLESTFPIIWVQGEISNFKKQSSGHLYFSLKDKEAQVSAVMFRGNASRLPATPKDGDKVILHGEINVYPPSGKYQIIVREIQQVGVGELLLRLEELKHKINKKGWFKQEHKKNIPKFPKRIGVVTSPTGAAIQDILNVLTRRFSGFHMILNPVRVQGVEAPGEIAQAIRQFNEHQLVDVMIIGRGGGSIEDLWAFNEEVVAEAVFQSKIPIIAAVGHETDHCIAEYVADVRAPTPSAAAEIVIAERAQQLEHLGQLQKRLHHTLTMRIGQYRHRLGGVLKHPLFVSPYYLLGPWMQRLDDQRGKLDSHMLNVLQHQRTLLRGREQLLRSLSPESQIAQFKQKLTHFSHSLDRALHSKIETNRRSLNATQKQTQLDRLILNIIQFKKEQLSKVTTTLQAIDPKKLLRKGYSILFSEKDGSVIKSVHQIEEEEKVRFMVSDGEVLSTINKVISK
ncbi:MAG: exodeoxyribonuclease VII large subunit [Chlamydiota bacterium]